MSETHSFLDLVELIRHGDPEAARELVRRYEPAIRREARLRLRQPRLRKLLDSGDICQQVLGSFFVRASLGQFELETPEQLLGLLARMARNKVVNEAERELAQRRGGDVRHGSLAAGEHGEELPVAAPEPTPSRQVAGRELLALALNHFSAEERKIVELRGQGFQWAEIAAKLGGTEESRRKQFARAVDRVAQALNLDSLTGN